MRQYLDLLEYTLYNGVESKSRSGNCIKIFDWKLEFDLRDGFPIVTTKYVNYPAVLDELLWFLSGSTNIKDLKFTKIWDEWKRPYTLNRDIVVMNERRKDYVPLNIKANLQFSGRGWPDIDQKLLAIWKKVMDRCYNTSAHNYRYYGGIGICVAKDWQDPITFISEVKELPNWKYKADKWNSFELDKDYYSSNIYSKDTCVWLSSGENNIYTKATSPCIVTNPEGEEYLFLSNNAAARKFNISTSSFNRFINDGLPKTLKRNNKRFEGWQFKNLPKNEHLRYALIDSGDLGPIYGHQWRNLKYDQIAELIHNITLCPESRRLVVSAWNVEQLPDMALLPCHFAFECFVSEGCLDLKWHQRSVDLMLGLPFNISSYATLLHILAKVANLTPRYLIGDLGNCHIYANHIKAAIAQITKVTKELPTLVFPTKNLFEYEIEDFKLVNYFHGPKLKLEIAV